MGDRERCAGERLGGRWSASAADPRLGPCVVQRGLPSRPTSARTPHGVVRTEEEDDGIMILRTPRTPPLAGTEALSCEWRTGDAW